MPNSKHAGRLPNQCYFLSQHQTNCLFICFFQTKGALLSNTRAGEICLLIKMLHIVFPSPRSHSVLQKNAPRSARHWSDEGKWRMLSLRTHGAAAYSFAFKEPRTTVRRGGGSWVVVVVPGFFFCSKSNSNTWWWWGDGDGNTCWSIWSIKCIAFVWISLLKEKRVYISPSVHVLLYMQPPSEYRCMNNLSCYNPTGNVLGIYILSSRAPGQPLPQS